MNEMLNVEFHRSWFGPFPYSDIYGGRQRRRLPRNPFFAYNEGPFDGPLEAGIRAQSFAQIPQAMMGGRRLGAPVFCPPGQMPFQTGVPGQSRCLPYSPPGAMIGATPATTVSTTVPPAYPTARTFAVGPYWGWRMDGARRRLGQEDYTLLLEERDRIVNEISAALSKVPPLDDLMAYSGRYDPDLRRTLGADASRFFALSNSIAPLFDKVRTVLLRLSDPDPEFWNAPDAQEAAAIRQWTTGVNEMHRIYLARRDQPLQLPPGVPPPPGFTRTSAAPATRTVPGAVTPSPTALPAGLGTTDILLGGGLAVGLGILIYALVS